MKRIRVLAGLTALALAASLAGCGGAASAPAPTETPAETPAAESPAPETPDTATAEQAAAGALRVAGLKGPTTMGLINLVDDAANGGEYGFTLDFSMHGAAE